MLCPSSLFLPFQLFNFLTSRLPLAFPTFPRLNLSLFPRFRAAAPKGTKSCRTQRNLSVRPSFCLPSFCQGCPVIQIFIEYHGEMTKASIWIMVPLPLFYSLWVMLREEQARIWVSETRIWVSETNFLVSEARNSVSEARIWASEARI